MILHLKSCKDKLLKFIRRVMLSTHSSWWRKEAKKKLGRKLYVRLPTGMLFSVVQRTMTKSIHWVRVSLCTHVLQWDCNARYFVAAFWWRDNNSQEKINISLCCDIYVRCVSIDDTKQIPAINIFFIYGIFSHWRLFSFLSSI